MSDRLNPNKSKRVVDMKKLGIVFIALTFILAACSGGSPDVSSADVVSKLQEAGLEADGATDMTKDDYGAAPMLAKEGKRILVPSLGDDKGGRIFIFSSTDDLEKTKAFYDELGKSSAMLFSWTAANNDKNVLIQMNGDMTEEQFKKYEEAINNM